jgi:hypothetical protein
VDHHTAQSVKTAMAEGGEIPHLDEVEGRDGKTLPRLAGVVTARREGQKVFYSLPPGRARDLLLRHVRP